MPQTPAPGIAQCCFTQRFISQLRRPHADSGVRHWNRQVAEDRTERTRCDHVRGTSLFPMSPDAGLRLFDRARTSGAAHRRCKACAAAQADGRSPAPERATAIHWRLALSMIIGTGVDICEVHRIAESIARFGDRFLQRVFTQAEIRYCQSKKNSVERFAARFAAKEAAMKALGTGASRGVTWASIEVAHESGGRPIVRLAGKTSEIAQKLGVKRVSLSVTHTESTAMAIVIFEDGK